MIQLIKYQSGNWHMIINNVPVIFTAKLHLYTDGLFPLRANVDNGLRWKRKENKLNKYDFTSEHE